MLGATNRYHRRVLTHQPEHIAPFAADVLQLVIRTVEQVRHELVVGEARATDMDQRRFTLRPIASEIGRGVQRQEEVQVQGLPRPLDNGGEVPELVADTRKGKSPVVVSTGSVTIRKTTLLTGERGVVQVPVFLPRGVRHLQTTMDLVSTRRVLCQQRRVVKRSPRPPWRRCHSGRWQGQRAVITQGRSRRDCGGRGGGGRFRGGS